MLLAPLWGCTPDEEKISKVIQASLDSCKASDDAIVEVKISKDKVDPMLREACDEPITELVIDSGIEATAKTGPYTWTVLQNQSSGVWVASTVDWPEFKNGKRILDNNEDPDVATMKLGVNKFKAAQEQYPKSELVREYRLKLLLKLRKKVRAKANQEDVTGIGGEAQAYYDELLAWSKETQSKDMEAVARVLVVDYLKGLERFFDMSLDTLGSRDDVLETSIKEAEKEKDKESADAYRKTLEESRAKRPAQTAKLEARKSAVHQRICKELAALDVNGVKDAEVKERAMQAKSGVDCTAAPKP